MDARVRKEKGPLSWFNDDSRMEVSSNLEVLFELVDKDVHSVAMVTEVPVPVVQALFAGTIKMPTLDHVIAIAHIFGIEPDSIEMLSRSFTSEDDRETAWREHLESKRLLKSNSARGDPAPSTTEVILAPVDDDSEDDAAIQSFTHSDLHLEEPEWTDDYIVALGDHTFDLKAKETRRVVMLNVRSAIAESGMTLKEVLEATSMQSRTTGWFSSVERGGSRIGRSDLEAFAKVFKQTIGVLLTGHGLKQFKPRAGSRKVDQNAVMATLPSFSERDWDEFFMSRVMTPNVKLAEGVEMDALMKIVLADRAGEPVDWPEAFMELTAQGQTVQQDIDGLVSLLGKKADQVKVLIIVSIIKKLWPEEESD